MHASATLVVMRRPPTRLSWHRKLSNPNRSRPNPILMNTSLTVQSQILKIVSILILDHEQVQYSNWIELFECHTHAFNVLDHINLNNTRPSDVTIDMWTRLDSIVEQWI